MIDTMLKLGALIWVWTEIIVAVLVFGFAGFLCLQAWLWNRHCERTRTSRNSER